MGAYGQKDAGAFGAMLTGDYKFYFSPTADPLLAQQYFGGWSKDDESVTASHLFSGYTPEGEAALPPAQSISIHLENAIPIDDNSEGFKSGTHKLLVTRVDGTIQAG